MAQLFGATRDALRHVVVPLWAGKKAHRQRTPWYLEPEPGTADTSKGLRDLIRDYPGNVVTGPAELVN